MSQTSQRHDADLSQTCLWQIFCSWLVEDLIAGLKQVSDKIDVMEFGLQVHRKRLRPTRKLLQGRKETTADFTIPTQFYLVLLCSRYGQKPKMPRATQALSLKSSRTSQRGAPDFAECRRGKYYADDIFRRLSTAKGKNPLADNPSLSSRRLRTVPIVLSQFLWSELANCTTES